MTILSKKHANSFKTGVNAYYNRNIIHKQGCILKYSPVQKTNSKVKTKNLYLKHRQHRSNAILV